MDAYEVMSRYERGVSFECGCVEQGLHPAVRQALLAGRLDPHDLMRCPVHKEPWIVESETPTGLISV